MKSKPEQVFERHALEAHARGHAHDTVALCRSNRLRQSG
jgi:hypothetical protein